MQDIPPRKRYVGRNWPRKDGGQILPRPPPTGKRPPNGVIWASSVDRFYYMQRIPNIEVITCWSLSMIKEWNQESHEESDDDDEIEPEPDPQLIWPYPFLTFPVEVYQPDGTIWTTARRSIQGVTRALLPALPRDDVNPFGKSFTTEDKLEEFIPDASFPDVLMVNDPDGITEGKRVKNDGHEYAKSNPIKYKRLWPILEPTKPEGLEESVVEPGDNVAYLNLAGAPLLGVGHHSIVHRAALRLPSGIEAHSADGSMAVAAKIAFPVQGARDLLNQEGEVYNRIYGELTGGEEETAKHDDETRSETSIRHLMENWSGFHLLSRDIRHPVPASAVVPKFFGYYVPVDESEVDEVDKVDVDKGTEEPGEEGDADEGKEDLGKEHRESAKEDGDTNKDEGDVEEGKESSDKEYAESDEEEEVYWRWSRYSTAEENSPSKTRHSPILLVEDCGVPIKPGQMNIDDRTECLSFIIRLFVEGISHSSFYARNIMVQPGPLSKPLKQRSMGEPSFRMIDLGRATHWSTYEEKVKAHQMKIDPDGDMSPPEPWPVWRNSEIYRAREELLLNPLGD